jgi:hypothetical protein
MSIQSEWQGASKAKPAEFELDYVNIKVQAIYAPGSEGGNIQVRLATAFDTYWQERKFEEWLEDWEHDERENDAPFEAIYPLLRELVKNRGYSADDRALLTAAINELEVRNSGLIRS